MEKSLDTAAAANKDLFVEGIWYNIKLSNYLKEPVGPTFNH